MAITTTGYQPGLASSDHPMNCWRTVSLTSSLGLELLRATMDIILLTGLLLSFPSSTILALLTTISIFPYALRLHIHIQITNYNGTQLNV